MVVGAKPCAEAIEVLSSHAALETKTFQGRPLERSAKIDVELHSTATTALSSIELAVFLGANLADLEATRPSALPTIRPRQLPGGGLAFRAVTKEILPAGATRTVRVEKGELPLELELTTVRALIGGCRAVLPVAEVTLVAPALEAPGLSGWYVWPGVVLAGLAGLLVLLRLRR